MSRCQIIEEAAPASQLTFKERPLLYSIQYLYYCLLRITRAAITPGTHPQSVRSSVMSIEPHPLSITARGGKMMDNITLQIDIFQKF